MIESLGIAEISSKMSIIEKSFENDCALDDPQETLPNHDELEVEFENDNPLDESEKEFPHCPENNGTWSGERGNSDWIPDENYKPNGQYTNMDEKTWKEILSEYDTDRIPFKDGEPDFSKFSKSTVEIDNFTDKRIGKGGNFDQADRKLMEQTGMTKEEISEYKKGYTWHEKSDCKTLELTPTDIHGNVRHSGGVAQYKLDN